MASIFAFKCRCCGEIHEGSPSFGFVAPDQYASLTVTQKAEKGVLTDHFCTITHADGTDYFIQGSLDIPIHGIEQPFSLGVWVSLSEKSFNRYREMFDNPIPGEGFFGWVCNKIAFYPYARPRPADVLVQPGGNRPKIVLHRAEPEDDPLVQDQVHGITVARAQELAELALHGP